MSFEQEKIIAFELDFLQLRKDYSEEELTKLFNLLKELGIYNNLFLFTNTSLQLASNFLREQGLDMGYLISNSGTCVYNLITKRKEKESFLDKEILELIVRFSFFNNLIFVILGANQSFIFGFDYLESQEQKIYSQLVRIKNLNQIQEVIENNSVYSLKMLFAEKKPELRIQKIHNFLIKLFELQIKINYLVVDPVIYLFSKSDTKSQIISEILEIDDQEIKKNLIYSSWSIPDMQLASNSFFWLSMSEFENRIIRESPSSLVLYLSKESQVWIDWWREHDYLWKERALKLDWISRKVKKAELLNKNNNYFELDLVNGLLKEKSMNEKSNAWEALQRKIMGTQKKKLITLFLWPEQLSSLVTTHSLKVK